MQKLIYLLLVLLFTIVPTISCSNKNTTQPPKNISESNFPSSMKRVETSENNTGYEQALPIEPTPASPAEITPPPPAPQEAAKDTPISSFQTVILNKDKERVDNIKLASSKINGYKLMPGKTFSFNKVVGKRTAAKGFKKATMIVNGDYEEALGGGICQLSSTLYNAADKAGLKIIERHSHTLQVAYVPKGRDAAISYGYKDLKFKNTKSYPVILRTRVENGNVYASVYKAE